MDKILFNDSFDYGTDAPLAFIADDKTVLKKQASSQVVDQWGDIEPIKDHSLIHLIALGAFEKSGCNKNGDAFKRNICKTAHPTFITKGALYRNHKAIPSKKEGYVVKTAFNEDMERVELLVAAQHDKCADWLGDIEKGKPVSFSMGFHCAPGDVCSICSNVAANRSEYCQHVKKNASYPYGMGKVLDDGRKCFVDNPWGYWNDISKVPVGADAIAMDLRKVAALGDDECMSGAELAENIGLAYSSVNLGKVALLNKLSAIEKRVKAIGIRSVSNDKKLDKHVSQKLRGEPVESMMGELAKTGAVLPMKAFFDLIFGDEYSTYETAINKAASLSRDCFSIIANDENMIMDVCSNKTYDANIAASNNVLWQGECRKLAADFSPQHEFAKERDLKTAGESIIHTPYYDSSIDSQTAFLLSQYAAYKLAALDTTLINDNSLLSAVLNS